MGRLKSVMSSIAVAVKAGVDMKLFECQSCHNAVHFDNTICLNCRHPLGYIQDRFEMSAVEATDAGWRALADPRSQYISAPTNGTVFATGW